MPLSKKIKIDNIFRLLLLLIILAAPLKFGLPFVENIPNFWPGTLDEWLIWSWPAEIFCLGVCGLTLLALPVLIKKKVPLNFAICGLLIFVFAVPSVIGSVALTASLVQVIQFGAYFLVWWLVVGLLNNEKSHEILIDCILFSSVIIMGYAVYQYFSGFDATWEILKNMDDQAFRGIIESKLGQKRVFSTFIYPNALAGYLLMIFPLCVVRLKITRSIKEKLFYISLTVLSVYVMVLTQSKGGLIVLSCLIFLVLYFWVPERGRKNVWVLGCFGALFWVWAIACSKINAGSWMARLDYWESGLNIVRDHLFTGTGPGTTGYVYPKYMLAGAEETKMLHNNFLQFFAEWGLVSFVGFLAFWGMLLQKSKAILRDPVSMACALGLTAFLIHSLVDFDLYVPGIAVLAFTFHGMILGRSHTTSIKIRTWQKFGICVVLVLILAPAGLYLWQYAKADYKTYTAEKAIRAGELKQGLDFLEDAKKMKIPFTWHLLGRLYWQMDHWDRAEDAFKQGAKSAKTYSEFDANLARGYFKLSSQSREQNEHYLKLAIDHMKKAIKNFPVYALYHAELAALYQKSGLRNQAGEEALQALEYHKLSRNKNMKTTEILQQAGFRTEGEAR